VISDIKLLHTQTNKITVTVSKCSILHTSEKDDSLIQGIHNFWITVPYHQVLPHAVGHQRV